MIYKNFTLPFLNYKPLKPQLRVFLAGHTVAMVTYYVTKRTTMCSPIIGQCFDTMIVASSDKEWLQWPIEILVPETVLSHLKPNSTWINDIGSKDLLNRPIYAVLNTHNLDMILQLKYMPIVMNLARIASSDWKSLICFGLWYALSSKRVRWPPIFFTFLI